MINIIIEAVLVALANCMDTFVVSTACGMQKSMTKKRGLLLALIFAITQTLFPVLGILIGDFLKEMITGIGHYIAFGLFIIIGLKALLEARNYNIKEKIFDISRLAVIITLAVATSMDAFIIGLGFGLEWSLQQQIITLIAIFVITLAFALIGVKIGSKLYFVKPQYALVFAALVFFAIGIKIILQATYFS
ncbi:MAG: manganese efflux pump MntP family protein [Bacteroidales bacterium]|jgi:putative Mn2+ efflux pump MntP|nr:manganese efflux pump MntP family protein [Bacteroidales bacterium]